MNTKLNTAAALIAALAATNALGQTTIPGDVIIGEGELLVVGDDTTFTGSLTLEAGSAVEFANSASLTIAPGASISALGTESMPVLVSAETGVWDGFHLDDNSTGNFVHTHMTGFGFTAIESGDGPLSITNCRFADEPGFNVQGSSLRRVIAVFGSSSLTIDSNVIGPVAGYRGANGIMGTQHGTPGQPGGAVYGVTADDVQTARITNNRFISIEGGAGGRGGNGRNGSTGSTGSNAGVGGSPGTGGTGGEGGDGGNGGAGGLARAVTAFGTSDLVIAQNIIEDLSGGFGGAGGSGGIGGRGGKGGRGATGVIGDGGRGGTGGRGGRGGDGGNGGTSGEAIAFFFGDAPQTASIANNTVFEIVAREGGPRGNRGSGGGGGPGGDGGSAGVGGSTGPRGSNGPTGAPGNFGQTGIPGRAVGATSSTLDTQLLDGNVHNNIFTFTNIGPRIGFSTINSSTMDIASNIVSGASLIFTGSVTGDGSVITAAPTFVGGGDYTPAPGSPAIDSGNNALVPAELVADYFGNPRFADDLATVNTGVGDTYIVDMGAVELPGETPSDCLADVNGDGMLSPTDFSAWVGAFNTGAPECDQNGDGMCTPTDFTAWVGNYNAGC
ncbi:MAG: GC-type dockerin domain-anchored protein [Phycisphaerales bacterium JB061]